MQSHLCASSQYNIRSGLSSIKTCRDCGNDSDDIIHAFCRIKHSKYMKNFTDLYTHKNFKCIKSSSYTLKHAQKQTLAYTFIWEREGEKSYFIDDLKTLNPHPIYTRRADHWLRQIYNNHYYIIAVIIHFSQLRDERVITMNYRTPFN